MPPSTVSSSIPEELAIPLAVGELVSGMTLVLTAQIIWSYGFAWNIFHDQKRQILLNFIMFLASINGVLGYSFNATRSSALASNICTLLTFTFVQYGLVIINHNSIARFNAFSSLIDPSKLKWFCLLLYLLPLVVFIPVYHAAVESFPNDLYLNASDWNKNVYKPMTLGLILTTEILATISDIVLLRSVLKIKEQLLAASGTHIKKKSRIRSVSLDLLCNYIFTWFFLFADILIKIAIIRSLPYLFDSIVSILTIALRARSNILYGLNMKDIFERRSTSIQSGGSIMTPSPSSIISPSNAFKNV